MCCIDPVLQPSLEVPQQLRLILTLKQEQIFHSELLILIPSQPQPFDLRCVHRQCLIVER